MSELVELARRIATKAHAGQTDKAGEAYITHPERVAARLSSDREKVVAWLLDVMEDCGFGAGDLIAKGIPSDIAAAVVAISRRADEEPAEYYRRVAANPLARAVKAADIADNSDPARLARLDASTRQRLIAGYADASRALGLNDLTGTVSSG